MMATGPTSSSESEWWTTVFTDREMAAMNKKIEAVLEEFGEDVEPIMVASLFSPDEFTSTLLALYQASMNGEDVDALGIPMAQEYWEQDAIKGTDELNVAATHFFDRLEDEDDEEEEGD